MQCSIPNCTNEVTTRKKYGWCEKHFSRYRKHGDPTYLAREHKTPNREKTCKIENCDKYVVALDLCRKHYARYYKYGDPLYVSPRQRKSNMSIEEFTSFFNSNLKQEGDCLLWNKCLRDGYGNVGFMHKVESTHRVAWYLQYGVWADYLCHKCGNKACCNTAHLYEGNGSLNQQDRAYHGGYKMQPEDIPQVFAQRSQGLSLRKIADIYKVTPGAISNILKGKTWAHLQDTGTRLES